MKVLIKPALKEGLGSGHLRRAVDLLPQLGSESAILVAGNTLSVGDTKEMLLRPLGVDPGQIAIREQYDPDEFWDIILLDQRETFVTDLNSYSARSLVVALDEGGEARDYLPYLIDCFPGRAKTKANVSTISCLGLPDRKRGAISFPFRKVLISFGGEDPMNLSRTLIEVLLGDKLFDQENLTLVEGPFFRPQTWPDGVTVLHRPGNLKERLGDYDLVFTSHGLTCYEALASGVPVILFNPSPYHRQLTRLARIPEIGVRRVKRRKLKRLLEDRDLLASVLQRALPLRELPPLEQTPLEQTPLASILAALCFRGKPRCPSCARGSGRDRAIERFHDRTYFSCSQCGLTYMIFFGGTERSYNEDYFLGEYRRQYGKTYLEDFDHIKNAALGRLRRITALMKTVSHPRLLDVGCAYGPFLLAAAEAGFRVEGIDIATAAVDYVKKTLGLPCTLERFDGEKGSTWPYLFNTVTMWFVIEHFRDLELVLRRCNRIMEMRGILAFSTPNGSGISARRNAREFYRNSPADHYTIWTPNSVARVLKRYGFESRSIRITGHHPERFPQACAGNRALFWLFSRFLGLGDTFEVYAQKVKHVHS